MKKIINTHMIILFALVISLLFMTTMYAAINSVTGDIRGKVIAEKQTGVYITDVQYVSDVNADLGASTITNYKGTFMQNTVKLSNTNSASEIKYKVTVYNNSDKSYPFLAVLYDEQFYDNPNIIFEISAEGYKIGDIINPHETRDIFITFKYKDGQIPANTTLHANLNFKIADPNRMMVASYSNNASTPYLRGSINKDKIETIKFELGKIEPPGTISSFDASEKQDGSIMGYYTDANNDGLYDLTFASNEPIYANTDASDLFQFLGYLKNISFENFSTFGVANMKRMFSSCSELSSLDLNKFDTSQVVAMGQMFQSCESLTKLDVSNFNTSRVTDMSRMFIGCQTLTVLDLRNFNTSNVTDMSSMFNWCSALVELDVSEFDTSKVTDMNQMFSCPKLKVLDVSKFETSQVTNMSNMFIGCNELTNLNVSNFNTSKVINMQGMFSGCRNLTTLDVSKFDTKLVTNMSTMFQACSKLEELNVSKFNTSKVTNMHFMFNGCTNLKSINVSNFNTNQVTDMFGMFQNCSQLTAIDLSNFNTARVTDMLQMFSGCANLTSLDISKFDTNQVTDMARMFQNCSNLQTIYVSEFNSTTNTGWTTSAVTESTEMFANSTKLVGGKGTKYDANHIDKEYARIDKIGEPGYLTNIKVKVVSPSEIFDQAGTNPDGLHIGDFVNYDAGTWTQEEINEIKTGLKSSLVTANGSTELPNKSFQFGGFIAGSSRNENVIPNSKLEYEEISVEYNYVKDRKTGEAITGWRVFDIEEDTVTLISAGNPENYYHEWEEAYQSEYILTGNVNSGWSNGTTESSKYQKRDWSQYVNRSQKAESARPLTKNRLDNWYTKYTGTPNADTDNAATFQKIYQDPYTKYQNIVENYSFYWITTACGDYTVWMMNPNKRNMGSDIDDARGVRILVSLSSDLKLTPQKIGTKTLTGGNMTQYGGDQTYNVWGIAGTTTGQGAEELNAQTLTTADYGGKVTNYRATNGSTVGWKIFHTDGKNIYLIADNYIENKYKPSGKNGTATSSTSGLYGANLNSAKDYTGTADIASSLKTKWFTKYGYTSTNYNAKATAYLLDTNVWSVFKDSTGYAEYAIGAPTLELFTASYNAKHSTDINIQSNSTGYQMKWSTESAYGTTLLNVDDSDNFYIINNLYDRTVFGTWLASPNAYNANSVILARGKDTQSSSPAKINYAAYSSYGGGLRPIVVLKPECKLQKQSDGTYLIIK